MKKFNSNMPIEEIIKITNVIIPTPTFFVLFCNDFEKAIELSKIYEEKVDKEGILSFFKENEKFINKEKFVLVMAYNYKENLKLIPERIEELKKQIKNGNRDRSVILELNKIIREFETEKIIYKKVLEFGKNIDKVISYYYYDDDEKGYQIGIIDSDEVFSKKISKNRKNEKKFDKIDKTFKEYDESHEHGIEYIIRPLILTDIRVCFEDVTIGDNIVSKVEDNKILRENIMTRETLQDLKTKNEEQYFKIIDTFNLDELIPEIIKEMREYSHYLDIDKLLLTAAYRYNEMLENKNPEDVPEYYYDTIRDIISTIRNSIEVNETKIHDDLDFKVKEKPGEYEPKYVEYTVKDLDDLLKRFIDNRYISKKEEKELKDSLLNGSITIVEINKEIVNLMKLTDEEIKKFMGYNLDNYIYCSKILDYNIEQIINGAKDNQHFSVEDVVMFLYRVEKLKVSDLIDLSARNYIKSEFFKKFSEEIDISSEINLKEINKKYLELKGKKDVKKEDQQKLDSVIEIYKVLNLDTENQEEKEELSNEVMYELAEDFEDEEDILFYYEKGLIALGTLAEWSGEQFIEKLYTKAKITDEDLMDLFKQGKISNRLIEENVLEEDISYEKLMSLISRGCLSEDKIVKLYMTGRIFDVDFEEMLNSRLISHEKYFAAVESRTKEKLEENAKIILSPDLVNIPNKKDINFNIIEGNEENTDDGWIDFSKEKRKLLIDPSIRYEFFEKLGALKANPIELDPSNSFYNYDFFVIPNSEGKLDLDSVVIAERFYEDKEAQDKFAFDNATYFFQYKDLMVNSNLSKKEMTEERDKIIFRANHRSGNWAVSVLQKIAQTMASIKFDKCTTEKEKDERAEKVLDQLHRILSPKQIKEILDLAAMIDDEEKYTYQLINNSYTAKDMGDTSDESNQR